MSQIWHKFVEKARVGKERIVVSLVERELQRRPVAQYLVYERLLVAPPGGLLQRRPGHVVLKLVRSQELRALVRAPLLRADHAQVLLGNKIKNIIREKH